MGRKEAHQRSKLIGTTRGECCPHYPSLSITGTRRLPVYHRSKSTGGEIKMAAAHLYWEGGGGVGTGVPSYLIFDFLGGVISDN